MYRGRSHFAVRVAEANHPFTYKGEFGARDRNSDPEGPGHDFAGQFQGREKLRRFPKFVEPKSNGRGEPVRTLHLIRSRPAMLYQLLEDALTNKHKWPAHFQDGPLAGDYPPAVSLRKLRPHLSAVQGQGLQASARQPLPVP